MDRINEIPHKIIASPDDPDFDEKVQAVIRQKLEAARILRSQQSTSKLEIPVLLFLVWLKGKCWRKLEIAHSTFWLELC
jgi:hypothetical protein